MEWSTIPACPSLKMRFKKKKRRRRKEKKKGNTEGTNSKKYVSCVCVCVCLIFVYDLLCRFDLRKGLHMRRVLKCAFAYGGVWSSSGGPVRFLGHRIACSNPVTIKLTVGWAGKAATENDEFLAVNQTCKALLQASNRKFFDSFMFSARGF